AAARAPFRSVLLKTPRKSLIISTHSTRVLIIFRKSFTALERGEASMKIRPLHDRLIVKRLEEERKTASGIVIPDTAAEKPDQGEVKAIGKGKVLEDGKV